MPQRARTYRNRALNFVGILCVISGIIVIVYAFIEPKSPTISAAAGRTLSALQCLIGCFVIFEGIQFLRMRTVADSDGIAIFNVYRIRPRRIPWSEVSDLGYDEIVGGKVQALRIYLSDTSVITGISHYKNKSLHHLLNGVKSPTLPEIATELARMRKDALRQS